MSRPGCAWTLAVGIVSIWPATARADEAPARAPIEEIRIIGRPRPAPVASSELVRDGMRYRRGRYELTLKLDNVFDTNFESAEFIYESRLRGEPDAGVQDRHFTPGNPRNLRAAVTYYF